MGRVPQLSFNCQSAVRHSSPVFVSSAKNPNQGTPCLVVSGPIGTNRWYSTVDFGGFETACGVCWLGAAHPETSNIAETHRNRLVVGSIAHAPITLACGANIRTVNLAWQVCPRRFPEDPYRRYKVPTTGEVGLVTALRFRWLGIRAYVAWYPAVTWDSRCAKMYSWRTHEAPLSACGSNPRQNNAWRS